MDQASGKDDKTTTNGGKTPTTEIPALLKWWRFLYLSLPRFKVDVSFTIATALVLTCLRFLIEFVLIALFGWPSAADGMKLHFSTKFAASSSVAIFHSINLVPALVACFLMHRYNPSQQWQEAPAEWRDAVTALLQFCTGYMLYDGLLNIVFLRWFHTEEGVLTAEDYMFLGHHVATTVYMSSTRFLGAGHMSAMMCMMLGEATNPFHNSYYIGQTAQQLTCCNGTTSQALFSLITFLFAVSYTIMRAIIGPIICLHMSYDLITQGRKNGIPIGWVVTWVLLIWGVILGSIPWIQDCWNMLLQHDYMPESLRALAAANTSADEL